MEVEDFIYTRKCLVCGKEFHPNTARQMMCSEWCRRLKNNNDKNLAYHKAAEERPPREVRCVVCGELFETMDARRKVCSDACKKEGVRRSAEKQKEKRKRSTAQVRKTRTCVVCGKEFEYTQNNQKTCSQECSYAAHIARVKKRYREKIKPEKQRDQFEVTCEVCGTKFITHDKRRKLCSKACAAARKKTQQSDANRRNREKPEGVPETNTYTCEYCGKTFTRKWNSKRVYCNKRCARLAGERRKHLGIKEEALQKAKEKRLSQMSIAEVCVLAKEAGMTYGQYMEVQTRKGVAV